MVVASDRGLFPIGLIYNIFQVVEPYIMLQFVFVTFLLSELINCLVAY